MLLGISQWARMQRENVIKLHVPRYLQGGLFKRDFLPLNSETVSSHGKNVKMLVKMPVICPETLP